jgi:hypothetical protein
MLIRLLTEDVNRNAIVAIVSRYFDSFTLFSAVGYWQGKSEQSLCIEIDVSQDAPPNWLVRVECIASEIKTLCKQDAVLMQRVKTDTKIL